MIGLLASAIGLVLGFGIAKGMLAAVQRDGRRPAGGRDGLRAAARSSCRCCVGTGITLLATIVPARRATRVPPIAAVREGSTLPASRFAAHSHKTGLGVVLASFAAISVGIFGGLGGLAAGLLLGLGVHRAVPRHRAARAAARRSRWRTLVGWPARRAGGVAGELAGANAVRNPSRTASTAAALMIGLTLVTVVAVLGAAMSKSTAVGGQRPAPRGLRRRRQRPGAVQRRRGRRAGGRARRQGRLARPLRQGAREGRGDRHHRHRPGHDRRLLPLRVDEGLRQDARAARRRTARS